MLMFIWRLANSNSNFNFIWEQLLSKAPWHLPLDFCKQLDQAHGKIFFYFSNFIINKNRNTCLNPSVQFDHDDISPILLCIASGADQVNGMRSSGKCTF